MQNAPSNIHPIQPHLPTSHSDLLDVPYLNAIANLADTLGAARFTPGGGVLLSKPLDRKDRASLPVPLDVAPRFLDLPTDRFAVDYGRDPAFRNLVDRFTVAHIQTGYRLVVIPLAGRLDARQLRAIAQAAHTFGHGNIRLSADVSIRLPNVPVALLRPLFSTLRRAGLMSGEFAEKAA